MASTEPVPPDESAHALADATARVSLDSSRSVASAGPNGASHATSESAQPPAPADSEPERAAVSDLAPVNGAESPSPVPAADDDTAAELVQLRHDKAALEQQYNSLLSKLTTMRSTLGGKLKQDAVRRHCAGRL